MASPSAARIDKLCDVLGHIGVSVPDLASAQPYYDELMELVGFEPFPGAVDAVAYRPAGGRPGTYLFLYRAGHDGPYDREAVGLQHLAFMVATRSAVHRVHEWVVARSGTVLHPPQEFPRYPPPYFATFWLDPQGFKLEAVCHHDRD